MTQMNLPTKQKQIHTQKEQTDAFVVTWMQVGIIILNEVSQKEKDKYHMIPLICVT